MNDFYQYAIRSLVVIVLLYCIGLAAIAYDGLNDKLFNADLIIVLGNKIETNGQPSLRLQARLDEAVKLFQQHKAKLIFVSGGLGKEGFDEATVMAKYLMQQQIPSNAIIIDRQGIDTLSTAKNASFFMKTKHLSSALVVTQYFHISRSKLALQKMGISQLGNAHARFTELRDGYSLTREGIAYVSYLFITPNAHY
jgi:vancomycin permeability regulator SanA